jgi:hypothetical protein
MARIGGELTLVGRPGFLAGEGVDVAAVAGGSPSWRAEAGR